MQMDRENTTSFFKKPLVLYISIAAILALLVGAFIYFRGLPFGNLGDDYIAKVDDRTISANLYRHALLIAQERALAQYSNVSPEELWSYQQSDGALTFARALEEFELRKLIRTAVINNLFEENGLELTAAQNELREKNIAQRIEEFGGRDAADDLFKKYYISYEDFVGFYEDYDRYELLFLHYFGVDGVYPVSLEEIDRYYEDNHARIMSIYIPTVDADGNPLPDEEMVEAVNLSVQIQEEAIEDGTNFNDLVAQYNQDPNLPANGYIVSRDYTTIPDFATAAFSMAEGDVRTILTDHGYYIMKKLPVLDASVYTQVERQKALLSMKSQDFEDIVTKATEDSEIVRNEKLFEEIKVDEISYRQ